MGIILGALGGAGAAAQEAGATMMKSDLDLQNRLAVGQQESELALQRAEALKEFEITKGNQQREAQASRIDAAAQPILQQGIVAKATAARANQLPDYDPNSDASAPGSFHGDAGQALAAINALPEGPDKQAALAQFKGNVAQNKAKVGTLSMDDLSDAEKAQFQPSASDLTHARTQAAIGTGDISPTEAAKLGQGAELAQSKLENAIAVTQLRGQAALDVAQARAEAYTARTQAQYEAAMAKLELALSKAGGGNTDFDKKIALLKEGGASAQDLASFIMDRKQPSLEDLANGFLRSDPNAGSPRAMTPEQALSKAVTLRSLTKSLNSGSADATESDVQDAIKRQSGDNKDKGASVLTFDPTTGTFH